MTGDEFFPISGTVNIENNYAISNLPGKQMISGSPFGKRYCMADAKKLSELFNTERSVVTKHLQNIFNSGELEEKSNVQNMHIANSGVDRQ